MENNNFSMKITFFSKEKKNDGWKFFSCSFFIFLTRFCSNNGKFFIQAKLRANFFEIKKIFFAFKRSVQPING